MSFVPKLSGFAIRIAFFYAAIFIIVGTVTPYLPVWFDWKGLTASQIGLVFAIPMFIRIVFTPLISYTADKSRNIKLFLLYLAWGSLLSLIFMLWADGFLVILVLHLLFSLFWTSVMPLTETMAMAGVRREGLDYGRMRLWGSISFIAASLVGGVVLEYYGAESVIWVLIAAGILLVISAYRLPDIAAENGAAPKRTRANIRLDKALLLIGSPLFLLFLLSTGLIQAGHAIYYAFGTLHWQSLGIPAETIGILWSVGVVAEIVLFAYSGWVIRKIGAPRLIVIAGLAAIIRWSGTAIDPPLTILMLLQVLHGLTFGAAHLGAVHYISSAVPEEYAGTAQGLYSATSAGIFMGIAMAASGPLYRSLEGQAYWAMGAMALVSLIAGIIVLKSWDGCQLLK